MAQMALLAAEPESPWVEWAKAWSGEARELVVVLQQPNEAGAEFRGRVGTSLKKLLGRRADLRLVALVGGARTDRQSLEDRSELMHEIERATADAEHRPQLRFDPAGPR